MDVNDDARARVIQTSVASKLAPAGKKKPAV
ncbi:MAG: hypothetical protein JWP42_2066 [Pseudomonas sp.]|nr:hypothetical protein [Pseudomonas sp.]